MSEETSPSSHLSLVSNFRASDYIYSFTNDIDDPLDGNERATVLNGFRVAAAIAGLKDYKLFESRNEVTIYLRSPLDVHRFKIATLTTDQVEQEFVQAEPDYDFRKLKRAGVQLQRLTDQAGFGNTLLFGVVRGNRSIMVLASSKQAYLAFDDYVAQNKEKFQKFFDLQREEPEFDLPEPTEDEAVQPNIIVYDENPIPERPASDLFIRGGATDETATAPTGQIAMAKSFNDQNYPWSLKPTIKIDPDRNGMDRLCQHDPSYPSFKLETKPPQLMTKIRAAMEGAAVDDYCLYNNDGKVEAHFKHPRDLAIAYASLYPSMEHQVDFVECSQNASPMKMHKKAKKLQAIFTEVGAGVDVKFVCDMDRKVIRAYVPTTDDLIRVQRISRTLERSDAQFQRIVGLN